MSSLVCFGWGDVSLFCILCTETSKTIYQRDAGNPQTLMLLLRNASICSKSMCSIFPKTMSCAKSAKSCELSEPFKSFQCIFDVDFPRSFWPPRVPSGSGWCEMVRTAGVAAGAAALCSSRSIAQSLSATKGGGVFCALHHRLRHGSPASSSPEMLRFCCFSQDLQSLRQKGKWFPGRRG